MSVVLSKETVRANPSVLRGFGSLVSQDIAFLRESYPGFDRWLWQKVVPGLHSGERTIIVETRNGRAAGLLIVKHTESEKKLCTLRVREDYESRGLGVRLFERAFDILRTERPLLSVSEAAFPKFARLFGHFGFERHASYKGLYVPAIEEFSYNGLLGTGCVRLADPQCAGPWVNQAPRSQADVTRSGGCLAHARG